MNANQPLNNTEWCNNFIDRRNNSPTLHLGTLFDQHQRDPVILPFSLYESVPASNRSGNVCQPRKCFSTNSSGPFNKITLSKPNQCRSTVATLRTPLQSLSKSASVPPFPANANDISVCLSHIMPALCNYCGLLTTYGDEKCDQRKWSRRILSSPTFCRRLNISHMQCMALFLSLVDPSFT